MNLKELQDQIFKIIRNQSIENCDIVINDKKIGVETRLNTYINSSYLKVKECIEDDFQAALTFIDHDNKDKDKLIKDYLTKYPADTHFINECGRNFLNYLHEINFKSKHDFLFDLIKLEWLRVESFYDFYNFKNQNNQKDQILINPSLKIMESNWPLDLIWEEKVPHSTKASHIFIWATEDRVVDCLSWEPQVAKVLLEIIKTKSLEVSVENLLEKYDADFLTSTLESHLSLWINKGLLQVNQT